MSDATKPKVLDIHIGGAPHEHSIVIGGVNFNLAKSIELDTGASIGEGTIAFDCYLPWTEPIVVEGKMQTEKGIRDVRIEFGELFKVWLDGECLTSNTRLLPRAVRATVKATAEDMTQIHIECWNPQTHETEVTEGIMLPANA